MTVSVQALDGAVPEGLEEALRGAGFETRADASMHLVCVDDYLSSPLAAYAAQALAEGRTWLPLKAGGTVTWLGPLISPQGEACFQCLRERLRANLPLHELHASPPPVEPLPTALRASCALAALQLARGLQTKGKPSLAEVLLTFDHRTAQLQRHPVSHRPQCPNCGSPTVTAARGWAPLVLASRPKQFTHDGGHRIMPPSETCKRLERHISPLSGVLSEVHLLHSAESRPWVTVAARYAAPMRAGDTPRELLERWGVGKGQSEEQARTSALCEALERHHGLAQGDEARVHARSSQLDAPHVPLSRLLHFSEAQYREREAWNRRVHDPRQRIPYPVDPDAPAEWTPAWSLTHGARRYLPTAYCYRLPDTAREPVCYHNYNGHAAGNCLEEAILQGFLELVERDAAALWWYNRVERPSVCLESFDNPWLTRVSRWYGERGWQLQVFELTADLKIPVFAAAGYHAPTHRLQLGFGCHLNPTLAVLRAVTELNQFFDGSQRASTSPHQVDPAELAFLLRPTNKAQVTAETYRAHISDDLREDVLGCVARAQALGLEVLVVDQSRPDIELCVVKVVVPELRHYWPRLSPGRLYDVPVRLGWLSSPLDEHLLNPLLPPS
jgi:bacteriocin biosynthesis cyclodehydratase domain-containing protein